MARMPASSTWRWRTGSIRCVSCWPTCCSRPAARKRRSSEYARALKLTPNRYRGLFGAARAAEALGDAATARAYYATRRRAVTTRRRRSPRVAARQGVSRAPISQSRLSALPPAPPTSAAESPITAPTTAPIGDIRHACSAGAKPWPVGSCSYAWGARHGLGATSVTALSSLRTAIHRAGVAILAVKVHDAHHAPIPLPASASDDAVHAADRRPTLTRCR